MLVRAGINAVREILTLNCGKRCIAVHLNKISSDTVSFLSQRIKILNLYNSGGIRQNLFKFSKNGKIKVIARNYGSEDLKFLEHIRKGEYAPPKILNEGTLGISQEAMEQSNRLAKDFISENEKLVDGFRYNGPDAVFDDMGKNISCFRSGSQEITVIDRNIDTTLERTIETFKTRINPQNYTETEKIEELMKFTDEIFSVEKSGTKTEILVKNMHSNSLKEVLLGDIINSGAGVCRHRSLLTKVLGDAVGLKTRLVQGYYCGGGHAWNEIVTSKGDVYLFDAMHGSIFDVSHTSKNIAPQVFHYRINDFNDSDKLVQKYFNPESSIGIIYRYMKHKMPINTSVGKFIPTKNGYNIEPLSGKIKVNGQAIINSTDVNVGDWIEIKDLGFQII